MDMEEMQYCLQANLPRIHQAHRSGNIALHEFMNLKAQMLLQLFLADLCLHAPSNDQHQYWNFLVFLTLNYHGHLSRNNIGLDLVL